MAVGWEWGVFYGRADLTLNPASGAIVIAVLRPLGYGLKVWPQIADINLSHYSHSISESLSFRKLVR